ncbi:unnamed protein product, partial [Mesorhabditis spiculigera]
MHCVALVLLGLIFVVGAEERIMRLRGDGWICPDGSLPESVKVDCKEKADGSVFAPQFDCPSAGGCVHNFTVQKGAVRMMATIEPRCPASATKNYCITFHLPDETNLGGSLGYELLMFGMLGAEHGEMEKFHYSEVRKMKNKNIYGSDLKTQQSGC